MAGTPTSSSTSKAVVERCWTLVGQRRGPIWYARRIHRHQGEPASVQFSGPQALEREEGHHDVIGFYHTHPDGPPRPSSRDVRTMRAWCSCFGKPLLCVIESPGLVCGFRFDDDESQGVPISLVEVFPRGIVIGVEIDGGQIPS